MLLLRLGLLRRIPRQASNRTSNGASNTILNTLAQVRQLALCLLRLALLVLLDAFLTQAFGAYEPANGFLCSSDVLVPGPGGAVVRVCCYAAPGRDGDGAGFGG